MPNQKVTGKLYQPVNMIKSPEMYRISTFSSKYVYMLNYAIHFNPYWKIHISFRRTILKSNKKFLNTQTLVTTIIRRLSLLAISNWWITILLNREDNSSSNYIPKIKFCILPSWLTSKQCVLQTAKWQPFVSCKKENY